MKASHARRLFATTAAGMLLAGGAAIGTAGTASAATPDQVSTNRGCYDRGGYWYDDCNRGDHYRTGLVNGTVVVIVVS
ncbi:hypothetical protein [Streptomyces sp. NPDC006193]|uniref:hypothetical protein n=1 Tax=Streptomyces sp. NPDC006193 TaxID=3155717 RepID=UPI0033AB52EA